MCINWPAKNHYADTFNGRTVQRRGKTVYANAVDIALHTVPNVAATQADFDANIVATLNYRDCPIDGSPIGGPASGGDQQRNDNPVPGSDLMMCGGCFTVPSRSPGVYDMQWQQTLNNEETYTSCSTLEILPGPCTPADKCGEVPGGGSINAPITSSTGSSGNTGGYTPYNGDTTTCMEEYPAGVFFHEPQMLKVPKSQVTTAEACAALCQATECCHKWSFKGDWDLTCFLKLKGVDDNAIVHDGAVSGCVTAPLNCDSDPTQYAPVLAQVGEACSFWQNVVCENGLVCLTDDGMSGQAGVCATLDQCSCDSDKQYTAGDIAGTFFGTLLITLAIVALVFYFVIRPKMTGGAK